MPHAVIESTGELQDVYQAFAPMSQRAEGEIVKVQECYLARSGREVLLDAVVIEPGTARSFSFSSNGTRRPSLSAFFLPPTPRRRRPSKRQWRWWPDSSGRCTRRAATARPISRSIWISRCRCECKQV